MAQRRDARSAWLALLDDSEMNRYQALRRDQDRARFLVGCTLVRAALGRRLGVAPGHIVLDRTCHWCGGPHGRIRLVRPAADAHVSVSHSGDWIIVALRDGAEVGVDVEQVDERIRISELSRTVLAPTEAAALSIMGSRVRPAAFTQLWCRKEAIVKCTGDGLRLHLTDIVVTDPRQPARLLRWDGRRKLVELIRLHDLPVDSSHRAAVAYTSSSPLRVQLRLADELLATLE